MEGLCQAMKHPMCSQLRASRDAWADPAQIELLGCGWSPMPLLPSPVIPTFSRCFPYPAMQHTTGQTARNSTLTDVMTGNTIQPLIVDYNYGYGTGQDVYAFLQRNMAFNVCAVLRTDHGRAPEPLLLWWADLLSCCCPSGSSCCYLPAQM
jgi:hypothetical protein